MSARLIDKLVRTLGNAGAVANAHAGLETSAYNDLVMARLAARLPEPAEPAPTPEQPVSPAA